MEKQKYEIRYYSKTGHTKKIAEAMAGALGCKAVSASSPIAEYTDILFLGGAIYAGKVDDSIREFINRLDCRSVGKIVLFGDAALANPCKKIRRLLADKNLPAETDEFFCRGGFKFIYKNHPDKNDLKNAVDFAKKWI